LWCKEDLVLQLYSKDLGQHVAVFHISLYWEYGGSGVDRLYSMILIEEQAYAMDSSTGFSLHSDIALWCKEDLVLQLYSKDLGQHVAVFHISLYWERLPFHRIYALSHLLCTTMPEEYGGSGVDRLYSMILIEEQAYAMDSSIAIAVTTSPVAILGNHFCFCSSLPKLLT
jgi:hypothetical protein